MLDHIYCDKQDTYPYVMLVKNAAFNLRELDNAYVNELVSQGVDKNKMIIVGLPYTKSNKASPSYVREQLDQIMPTLKSIGAKHIFCCDSNYFKVLTKEKKADVNLGYVLQCQYDDCQDMDVVLGVNHKALIHNPSNEPKMRLGTDTYAQHLTGQYTGLGSDIIKSAAYPKFYNEIQSFLKDLMQYPELTADFETFSLKPFEAGIATCGFAWNKHEGIAFPVDYEPYAEPQCELQGSYTPNAAVRELLKQFLTDYPGTLTWHNASFDIKIAIATLWMKNPLDYAGLLLGLETLTERFEDTKIIAYLALNSTAYEDSSYLSLKKLAHPYAGNWAQEEADIKDVRRIPLDNLLEYNLVDCLSTWYVRDELKPVMIEDQQEDLYEGLMKDALIDIIQCELVGMPMEESEIVHARKVLEAITTEQKAIIFGADAVKQVQDINAKTAYEKDFEERKKKAKFPEKILYKEWDTFIATRKQRGDYPYNPGSGPQTRTLLYDVLGLPVVDLTKTKLPAVGAKTLEKLINHTSDPDQKVLMQALIDFSKADKILSTFIPAFEAGVDKGDGRKWLHGSFNLGGTLSGRLSSSDPNLQNLPSGSKFGGLIKNIFQAPEGWIFCGADFASLEDRINALLTKDPNKIKVYVDGFDGHALRTVKYWPEMFPDVDPDDPEQVNALKKTHKKQRELSKGPSFAMQYLGDANTLVKNNGFSYKEASAIYDNYNLMYQVSLDWVKDGIDRACKVGYAEAAFGLRIRTPLLHKSYLGHKTTTREAEAESRSLGNAISGQSYGLLNNRAMAGTMKQVRQSQYRFEIMPVGMIHDACYFLVRDNLDALKYLNDVLVKEMQWQELPEIAHDAVKLGAELDVFWPSWNTPLELPNASSREEIHALCMEHLSEQRDEGKRAA